MLNMSGKSEGNSKKESQLESDRKAFLQKEVGAD